jgi:hypothetical protein
VTEEPKEPLARQPVKLNLAGACGAPVTPRGNPSGGFRVSCSVLRAHCSPK